MRKITMTNIVRTLGAFILTAFFVSGCSNFLDFDKRSENSTEGKGRLVFNASQSRNAQTVTPDSLDLERDLGISFTLYGTKEGGTEVKLGRWEKEVVQAEDIEGDEGLIPHYGSVWAGASPSLSARAPAQVEELVSAYEKMRSDTSILVDTGNWTFRLEVSDYNDEKILQKTVFKTYPSKFIILIISTICL